MSIETILPNAEQMDALIGGVIDIAKGVGAYSEPQTWKEVQARVRAGIIGKTLGIGDQLTVEMSETLSGTVSGTGITAVSVTKDTFLAAAGTEKRDYEFTFDGAAWHYNGMPVTLSDYGISVTGTAANGDVILIHRTATPYDFDVEGIDGMQTVNELLTHNLSILMHNVYKNVTFDPAQYLFAVTEEACTAFGWPTTGDSAGMPAGTYNITLSHGSYNGGTDEDGTYQFTTTSRIPIGGGIRHSTIGKSQSTYDPANITGGVFITYGADTTTTIETSIATTAGSSGTNLGTTTACDPQYKSGDYINFTQRQVYGTNRWATSFMRQFLNSADETLQWHPSTIWSRNSSASIEGYLHAIDPELRAVLQPVRIRYAKSIVDGYGYEDIEDIVTLETMLDVYGYQNNGIYEGPVTSAGTVTRTTFAGLWKDAVQADKIKYRNSSASDWWLSSAHSAYGNNVRRVLSSGAISANYSSAYSSYGVVPRLTIA